MKFANVVGGGEGEQTGFSAIGGKTRSLLAHALLYYLLAGEQPWRTAWILRRNLMVAFHV